MLPNIRIGNVSCSTFSIVLMIAFYCCLFYLVVSKENTYAEVVNIIKMAPICICFSVVFGKGLYAVTAYSNNKENDILNGFVFYGGLLGALIGMNLFCKIKAISMCRYSDILTRTLPLGQAIGRIGCYFNGCCYGIKWDGFGTVSYVVDGKPCNVFPTWFAESIFCLLLFFILMFNKGRNIHDTDMYMLAYAFFRFLIEFFRGDNIRGRLGGLSTSQIISLFIIVIVIWNLFRKRGNGND